MLLKCHASILRKQSYDLIAQFTKSLPIFSLDMWARVLWKVSWKSMRQRPKSFWLIDVDSNGLVYKLKIYDEVIEYTRHSVDSQQPSELRYKRVTNEFLCAICECTEHQESSATSSRRDALRRTDAISSRPEFAFDDQCFPGHVSVRLKDGIGNEDDSSAFSADRVI